MCLELEARFKFCLRDSWPHNEGHPGTTWFHPEGLTLISKTEFYRNLTWATFCILLDPHVKEQSRLVYVHLGGRNRSIRPCSGHANSTLGLFQRPERSCGKISRQEKAREGVSPDLWSTLCFVQAHPRALVRNHHPHPPSPLRPLSSKSPDTWSRSSS